MGKSIFVGLLCFAIAGLVTAVLINKRTIVKPAKNNPTQTPAPTLVATPIPTPTPTVPPTPKPKPVIPTSAAVSAPKIIFGIGSQAGPAMDYRIVKEAPVHMLTSWYNGTKDLEWMQVQKNDLIPRLYAKNISCTLLLGPTFQKWQ